MFCEGTRTEPEYLQALRREPAVREVASVEIRIDMEASGAVPLTLVREATEARVRNPQYQGDVDEVWCLFDDQTAWLTTTDAGRLRRDHDGSSGKGLDGATYMSRRTDAARRARTLAAKHAGDGTDFPRDNPSSGMYQFLDAIEPD